VERLLVKERKPIKPFLTGLEKLRETFSSPEPGAKENRESWTLIFSDRIRKEEGKAPSELEEHDLTGKRNATGA